MPGFIFFRKTWNDRTRALLIWLNCIWEAAMSPKPLREQNVRRKGTIVGENWTVLFHWPLCRASCSRHRTFSREVRSLPFPDPTSCPAYRPSPSPRATAPSPWWWCFWQTDSRDIENNVSICLEVMFRTDAVTQEWQKTYRLIGLVVTLKFLTDKLVVAQWWYEYVRCASLKFINAQDTFKTLAICSNLLLKAYGVFIGATATTAWWQWQHAHISR